MNFQILLLIACLICSTNVIGQVKVKMGGRLYMDAGCYVGAPEDFSTVGEITDVRITSKVSLGNDWRGKIDVSFANNEVKIKDVFIEKALKNHYFRLGHMYGMFSIDQSNSSNDFLFMTPALVANMFAPSRRVGVSYTYAGSCNYFSTGAFMGDKLHFDKKIKQGRNFTGRFVYHPFVEKGKLVHVGIGVFFRKPDHMQNETETVLDMSTKGNTKLSSPNVFDFHLPHVNKEFQWNVEILGQLNRFFVQSEYMQMLVKRNGVSNFKAHGGYLEGGIVLKGGKLNYDLIDALPICPNIPGSLLLFTRVSITDLNHGVELGGKVKDIALGINYYLTQHLIFRVNYSHQWADARTSIGHVNWGVLQGRIQLKF